MCVVMCINWRGKIIALVTVRREGWDEVVGGNDGVVSPGLATSDYLTMTRFGTLATPAFSLM